MDVFDAIADPIRRSILEQLNGQDATAGEVASWFDVSRPAISRHLRVMRRAGLVATRVEGRHHLYSVHPGAFAEVEIWLEQFDDQWTPLLDALETEIFRTRKERRDHPVDEEKTA